MRENWTIYNESVMPSLEPVYCEEIDDLLVLMVKICSEGEPDNLQPVCNAISKVRTLEPVYYEEIDDLLVLMVEICSEGEPDNLQPVCNAISKVRTLEPILARSDDISSRSLAFDALNYGI